MKKLIIVTLLIASVYAGSDYNPNLPYDPVFTDKSSPFPSDWEK